MLSVFERLDVFRTLRYFMGGFELLEEGFGVVLLDFVDDVESIEVFLEERLRFLE